MPDISQSIKRSERHYDIENPSEENLTLESRLKAIRKYNLEDPIWATLFKDIAQLAAQLLDAPYGAVNIMGEHMVWTVAINSGTLAETPIEFGLCPSVVKDGQPVIVPDARIDIRFANKPSVLAEKVRSYFGVPLLSPGGYPLGSVCAWGPEIAQANSMQVEGLLALSRQASQLIELHYLGKRLDHERRNQQLASEVLSNIVAGQSLEEVLALLANSIEVQIEEENAKCSILLVHNRRLCHIAAPNLPDEFIEKIDGLEIGENVGSCGRTASTGIPSVTSDIMADSDWEPLWDIAKKYQIKSCCSFPIFDSQKSVIATFALYYDTPGIPSTEHWALLEEWASLVGLAITRAQEQAKLRRNAASDPLTGLPNRSSLIRIIENALRDRKEGSQVAVLLCDLDGFKLLNDSLGHAHGDEFLIQLSNRLIKSLEGDAHIARLGGDEFVAVMEQINSTQDAEDLAAHLLSLIRFPTQIAEKMVTLTGSLGIAISELDSTPEDLLREADAAMYISKTNGKNRYSVASAQLRLRSLDRFETEVDLREAIQKNELYLDFQPNVNLTTGKVRGVEALLRWHHPVKGMISPDLFIPIAEESDLILHLGSWILQNSCLGFAQRRELDLNFRDVKLWVNVSARQLTNDFPATVANALELSGIPANRLGLEITESIFMHDVNTISKLLTKLRNSGISIAIDDFGTGFSSLAQLRKLPVDVIKIDKAFIDGIGITGADESVVIAIIKLAEALGIHVVAEGVETKSQHYRLMELGCNHAQGYLFGLPTSLDKVDGFIAF